MVSSLVFFSAARGPDGDVTTLAQEVASRLRECRDRAVQSARDEAVVVDVARGLVQSTTGSRPVRVGSNVQIVAMVSDAERPAKGVASIRFFPNGASTGGKLRFEQSGRVAEVAVNWLTGRVTLALSR